MNNSKTAVYLLGLLVAVTATGCATQSKLTQDQVMSQYEQVSLLDTRLREADQNESDFLAPSGFKSANQSLEKAIAAARNNKVDVANQSAADGIKVLDKVDSDTLTSKKLLGEVLAMRDKAQKAGAPSLNAKEYAKLEDGLQSTAQLIEKGQAEQAKQRRPQLIEGYSQLQLTALKSGLVDVAKAAIESAEQEDAEEYAPKTLGQAQEEMRLALSILDADRRQTEKADTHSKNAKWLAEKSAAITEIIKDFDRRDYTEEDMVLWYQNQLSMINEPLGGALPFNEENAKVVGSLQQSVSGVVSERNLAQAEAVNAKAEIAKVESNANMEQAQTKQQLLAAEQQIAALMSASQGEKEKLRQEYEQKLAMSSKQTEAKKRAEREQEERFEKVQALFGENEANVYRQRSNVLISAHGFKFPPGQSEINAENFPMMNKIVESIKKFPNARIKVEGHTDASGDDSTNQALSQQRAETVAEFLKAVGGIPAERITKQGFGEAKPVASNETSEGRALNRRVEIAIINEQ